MVSCGNFAEANDSATDRSAWVQRIAGDLTTWLETQDDA